MPCNRQPDPRPSQTPPSAARCSRELSDRLQVEVIKDCERRSLRALAEFLIDATLCRLESEHPETKTP